MGNKLSFPDQLAIKLFRNGSAFFFLLIFFFIALAPSHSYGQVITIERVNAPVGEILKTITKQSNLNFSYSPKLINASEKITFRIKGAPLEQVLDQLASQLNIGYTLLENQIILHEREIVSEEPKDKKLYTISGFINDAETGESLIGASISVKGSTQGVTTNSFGFYALQLPAGPHTLLFSYVGFEAQRMLVKLSNNQKQNIPLKPVSMHLPSITVKSKDFEGFRLKQNTSMELRPEELNRLPEFGGESGLVKGLQTLPGIKSHSDGSAFFYVRGGAKDQNLIIIDDAPIYNPSHLFGFYSVIVPDFTKSMQVYKNDIPVHLGDRLSSVIDIRTKDGNLNKTEFNGAFNPLITRVSVEGPLKKEVSSYFVSYRGSNLGWIARLSQPEADLGFIDFNVKWNVKFNSKNRLYHTILIATDRFNNSSIGPDLSGISWSNVASILRWNHIFGEKLFSNTTLYSGVYNYRLSNAANKWESNIGRLSLKSDFTHYHRSNQNTRFGMEFNNFSFNPGDISGEDFSELFPSTEQNQALQIVLYANRTFNFQDRWHLSLGVRGSYWHNLGPNTHYEFDENYQVADTIVSPEGSYNSYWHVDPRVRLQYEIDPNTSVKLCYGIYHQYLQLITNSVSPFTALEVWLPSSPNIKPQSAQQVNLSFHKHLPKRDLNLTAEVYYKLMDNQIDYVDHANTLLNPLVEGELRFGKMHAYGVELMLKKETGRLNGWVTYNYSRAIRQTDDVNGGRNYPAFQDRPHDFSLMLNYRLKRRVFLSSYFTWYNGSTFSSPTGFYDFNNRVVPIYGEKHNDRLPNYNRLDLAIKFILNKNPDNPYKHSLMFSVYNVLAHKNIVAVNFNKSIDENNTPVIEANLLSERELSATQANLIRFFPSLTYTFNL